MKNTSEKETNYKSKFGMKVTVKFNSKSPFGRKQNTYHNVTEIHRNYGKTGRIAFESDIHSSGITQDMDKISSYSVEKEKKKAKSF